VRDSDRSRFIGGIQLQKLPQFGAKVRVGRLFVKRLNKRNHLFKQSAGIRTIPLFARSASLSGEGGGILLMIGAF
jgi:hypothetical protein